MSTTTSTPTTFGDRVRLARHNKEWTLDDLHIATELSKGFLSDLENNKRDASMSTVIALSDALNVTVEWLVRGKQAKLMTCPTCKGKGKI